MRDLDDCYCAGKYLANDLNARCLIPGCPQRRVKDVPSLIRTGPVGDNPPSYVKRFGAGLESGGEAMMQYTHELKSWVGLFEPIMKGEKTHDLRVMDRDYQIGQVCLLREYDPVVKTYTGREAFVEITYITSAKHAACAFSPVSLHPATAILSVKLRGVVAA